MAGNEIIKLLSDNKQLYFKNNNISTGSNIPTSGDYVKGDIVINTGTTQNAEPMWLCIESGSPGRWIIVGKVADIPQDLLDLVTEVGDITGLTTDDKSSIVAAINEHETSILNQGKDIENLKQSGVNIKSGMVQAINSKKTVPDVTTNDTWETMTQRVTDIKEGSGNAVKLDVLVGKTFTNNDGIEYVGTMPNRPAITPCSSNVLYQHNVYLRFPIGAYMTNVGASGDPEVYITPQQLANLGFPRFASGSYQVAPNAPIQVSVRGLSFRPHTICVECTFNKVSSYCTYSNIIGGGSIGATFPDGSGWMGRVSPTFYDDGFSGQLAYAYNGSGDATVRWYAIG